MPAIWSQWLMRWGGAVSEVELKRAKNATISSVLMNLESRVRGEEGWLWATRNG